MLAILTRPLHEGVEMPKRTYTIEWDSPDEEHWLPPDNVAVALHSYCPNTRFVVTEAAQQNVQRTVLCTCFKNHLGTINVPSESCPVHKSHSG